MHIVKLIIRKKPHQVLSKNQLTLISISTIITIWYYASAKLDYKTSTISFHQLISKATDSKIDWHDYKFIDYESKRTGPGEQGASVELGDANLLNSGLITDLISVNRSLPDERPSKCKTQRYLSNLPSVSVIIPFFNERFATIMRTAHSTFNRAPQHLIREIIFINDASDHEFLNATIDDYVAQHFLGRGRVLHMRERVGLIQARMAGAREANGEVLLFLDAHTEATVNFLPPLLEPIAEDFRVCTTPTIDTSIVATFSYPKAKPNARAVFDWRFNVWYIPNAAKDGVDPGDRFPVPLMKGGLFAISAKFFWELGGYDDQLEIWGGEQFELSFKIWMCGGQMYQVPCSRFGHFGFRINRPFNNPRPYDYISRNYKRVFEVWLDEYKEYVYMRDPDRWARADAGPLLAQHYLRKKLKCKSFKWFLETVAPEIPMLYPVLGYPWFAKGAIRSVGEPTICVDTLGVGTGEIGMYPCQGNRSVPNANQRFELSFFKDIAHYDSRCIEVPITKARSKIFLAECKHGQNNQRWRYEPNTQMLIHDPNRRWCLECDRNKKRLHLNLCNVSDVFQKWDWGFKNQTMLGDWKNMGAKFL